MIHRLNTRRAAGFSPRGSSHGGNAGHAGRPRGLKPAARCLFVFASLIATSVHADTPPEHPTADSKNPPQGRISDDWMAIMINGQKVGYMHAEQERVGDEIRTRTSTKLTMKRATAKIEILMKTTSTETLSGEPLAFSSEQRFGQFPITQKGTIKDGMITVVSEQLGQKIERQIAYPKGALMEWGMQLETLKYKLEPGTVIKLDAFVPIQALNVALPTTTEILKREDIEVLGRSVSALKTKSIVVMNGVAIETIGWVDADLTPLRQEMELMGLKFEMVRCDMAFAMEDVSGAEVFVNTLIPIHQQIDRDATQSVTYRISGDGKVAAPNLPETGLQKIISRNGGDIILKVTRFDFDKLKKGRSLSPPAELEEYLKASVMVSSNDAAVIELARAAVGAEKDPHAMARLLCRKVAAVIEDKDLGTAFATAAEGCRRKTGDCTEHGVLLAALGRVVGIPSRVVTGLIYVSEFGGQRDVLGFHMWTQFWIAGQWIDFDAAWDQVDVDPTHIALTMDSLQDASVGGLMSPVMLKMNSYRISIIDSDPKQ